jgi:hypothetical protein
MRENKALATIAAAAKVPKPPDDIVDANEKVGS